MKEFSSPAEALCYALPCIMAGDAEVFIFIILGEKIVEFHKGSKKQGEILISKHRGRYAIISGEDIEFKQIDAPFSYGLCLN